MTTFLLPSAIYGRSDSRCQSRRRDLLDRFWDAFRLDSPESPDNDNIFYYGPIAGYDEPSTPEIFSKFGSTPTIQVKSAWQRPTDRTIPPPLVEPSSNLHPSVFVEPPTPMAATYPAPEEIKQIKRHFWNRSPSKTAINRPKLSIPQDLKPRTPGISSPATAVLAMASNFLDDIVRLTRAQSPSSNTMVVGSPEGDIEIVDSEVYINVIDDGKRSGITSALELQEDDWLDKLEIPPMIAFPASDANYDMLSPFTVNGTAENARELDALSQMNWERQLSNLNCSLRH